MQSLPGLHSKTVLMERGEEWGKEGGQTPLATSKFLGILFVLWSEVLFDYRVETKFN